MARMRSVPPTLGVIAVFILAVAVNTGAQNLSEKEWWEDTVVYQIWPRSFQDSDGDGSGDLQGIISRLGHFTELSVETIWLNAIYPSPLANSGFDVSNFRDIDSRYGNLEDFAELISAAHDRGLRIILDFIPNHSSVQHSWFNASVYRADPYTDYYVWHDGILGEGNVNLPPNNWKNDRSDVEGSAWEWNEIRQQWYLHQFTAQEADFDLRNEALVQELLEVLDFWLDRGVDGFYISGVPYFLEDEDFTDSPSNSSIGTFGRPENAALLYRFREHVDSWVSRNNNESKFLTAEGFEADENLITYYGNASSNGVAPVNVHFITDFDGSSNASYIKTAIDAWISAVPENETTNWKLSNQDYSRISSRYSLNRADGLNMLVLALPGRVFTYYGEEIAMLNHNDITYAETVDPVGLAAGEAGYSSVSRDPFRTPMQWDASNNAGFSSGASPYLPVNANYETRNVASQLASTLSNIRSYRRTAALRSQPAFSHGSYELHALNNDRVLVLRRSLDDYWSYVLVINLGLARQSVNLSEILPDLPTVLNIAVRSNNAVFSEDTVSIDDLTLTANAAIILTDGVVDDDVVELTTTTESSDEDIEVITTTESSTDEDIEVTTEDSGNFGSTVTPTILGTFLSLCFSLVSFYCRI